MRVFRTVLAGVLAFGLAVGATGCAQEDLAARVNGEGIPVAVIDEQVDRLRESSPQMFEGPEGEARLLEFRQAVLNREIDAILWRQAAEERGVEVTDAQVEERLEQLRAGFVDEAQFEAALSQNGMTLEELNDQLRQELLTTALLAEINQDTEVLQEEIQEYYDANKAVQFTEQAAKRASHILFETADRETAERVLAEIREGGDFAALAKEYSQDAATAVSGGDLGWPTVPFVPEFQQALDGLDMNEVSNLVETQFGWHIIKAMEQREERVMPLEEVSEQIQQMILQQRDAEAYQSLLAELRETADIEILIPELEPPAAPAEGGEPAPEGGSGQ